MYIFLFIVEEGEGEGEGEGIGSFLFILLIKEKLFLKIFWLFFHLKFISFKISTGSTFLLSVLLFF